MRAWARSTFTYTGETAVGGTGYGTCGTNNCHNDGKGGAPIAPAYTWGTVLGAGTNSCTECHNATPATLTTQSHQPHLYAGTSFGINTVACASCHPAATVATHADRKVDTGTGSINFTYTGETAVGGAGFGTCGTNNCHNSGKNAVPRNNAYTWGTAIANCTECHGNDAASMAARRATRHTWVPYRAAFAIPTRLRR